MARRRDFVVQMIVEGLLDEAVARRLIEDCGALPGITYGRQGRSWIEKNIRKYNGAAEQQPFLVLVDGDGDCGPEIRAWVPSQSRGLCFRAAIREIESWLLADRQDIATFLRVGIGRIPADPESHNDPKSALVAAAAHSRSRALRDELVARPGSGVPCGPAYDAVLSEFVATVWEPKRAAAHSPSLARALAELEHLVANWRWR